MHVEDRTTEKIVALRANQTEHGQFDSGENLNGTQVIDFLVEPIGIEPTTS